MAQMRRRRRRRRLGREIEVVRNMVTQRGEGLEGVGGGGTEI
jgi:hypothetical protein